MIPFIEEILKITECFEFLICNRINLCLSYLSEKSKLQELRGHKVVSVRSHTFNFHRLSRSQ